MFYFIVRFKNFDRVNNEYQIIYDKSNALIQPVEDDSDIMLSK